MIHTAIPFRADKNLGRAYNEFMALLPEDAWACFLDHDAMLLTTQWHAQVAEAIEFRPEAGAFVATTNRIASPWQRVVPDSEARNNDIAWHRRFASERLKLRTLLDITGTKGFGGVLFAVSKRAWQECGGFADGLGCVDHSLHFALRKAGRAIYLIEGLYVYHWRHFGEPDPTKTAPKAPNCPCQGAEEMPTRRVRLPRAPC